jgi:hypothetical protein
VRCGDVTERSESVRSRDDGREEHVKHGWGLTILALGLNLDQYLLLSHDLDNLPNVRSRFTKDK